MTEDTSQDDHAPTDLNSLIAGWRKIAVKAADRHAVACDHFAKLDFRLGQSSTVFSAIVGCTVFATLQQSNWTEVKVMAGFVAVASAVLSAMGTSARYGARSELHRQSSRHYGALVRVLDEFHSLPPTGTEQQGRVDAIRKALDDAGAAAPDVPPKIWDAPSTHAVATFSSSQRPPAGPA